MRKISLTWSMLMPMQHHVHDHGIVILLHQLGHALLELEGARAGQEVVQLPRRILKRQLNVV
jgi:hypothetical protein